MKFDLEEVKESVRSSTPESRIYIGADSERYKNNGVWFAEYTIAVIIHRDGCHGCRVFGKSEVERDYDQHKNKPRMRLMTEVMKAAAMYLELEEAVGDRYCEVHLDINPDEAHASSIVIKEAVGYIRASCLIEPKVKPEAFAASFAADRLKEILYNRNKLLENDPA